MQLLIEQLADQLIEVSDRFVLSMEGCLQTEGEYFDFLRSRKKFYGVEQEDYDVPDDLWKDTVPADLLKDDDGEIIRNASLHGTIPDPAGFQMPKMPNFGNIGAKLMAGGAMASNFMSRLGKGKRGDQAELDRAQAYIKKNPNFGRERAPADHAELDRAKAGAAAITKPTKHS